MIKGIASYKTNLESFYKKYCAPYSSKFTSIEALAANKSFQTATKQAIKYNGKNAVAKKVRARLESSIIELLEKRDFSTGKITELMDKIRNEYQSEGITDWTYGNSQKWINIAIKYYFVQTFYPIISSKTQIDIYKDIDSTHYELCPIDGIMIDHHFNRDFGLRFKSNDYSDGESWSNCDDLCVFIKFWNDCKIRLTAIDHDENLSMYEVEVW